jgi:hypothetical protein
MKEMKLNVVYLSWSQDGTTHPWGYVVVMDVLGTGLRYLCNNKGKKMFAEGPADGFSKKKIMTKPCRSILIKEILQICLESFVP